MIVQDVNMCLACGKVFCCPKCRMKHEQKYHDNAISCPICYNQNLVLDTAVNPELINHLSKKHSKLHCIKCLKVYTNIADMAEFTKCLQPSNSKMSVCSSTQTSPFVSSKYHLLRSESEGQNQLQTTVHNNNNNTSEISLKNVSVINNSFQSKLENDSKGKLVRSTSTPVQDFGSKLNPFDGSAEQIANIYGCSSNVSPPAPPPVINVRTPISPKPDKIAQRITKHHMTKAFISKPVTPLRQVMSNSIRRAITEHGTDVINFNTKSKYFPNSHESPLDLRTSPALRRVHSEVIEKSCFFDHFHSSKTSTRKSFSISSKQSMESISIKSTRKSTSSLSINQKDLSETSTGTVYRTCRSIEIITTEMNEVNASSEQSKIFISQSELKNQNQNSIPYTPKVSGAIKKKTIDFKTPKMCTKLNDDNDDVFYTPQSVLGNKFIYPESILSDYSNGMNDVSDPQNIDNKDKSNKENDRGGSGGKLWSLVASLIRLPSFGNNPEIQDEKHQPSLIKRCASFAGYLTKSKLNDNNELQSLKRKRTSSNDIQCSRYHSSYSFDGEKDTSAKRMKRIHGRKPISRMRDYSIEYT